MYQLFSKNKLTTTSTFILFNKSLSICSIDRVKNRVYSIVMLNHVFIFLLKLKYRWQVVELMDYCVVIFQQKIMLGISFYNNN